MLQRLVVFLLCYLAIIPMKLRRRQSSSDLVRMFRARHHSNRRFGWLTGRRGSFRTAAYYALPVIGAITLIPVTLGANSDLAPVVQTTNAALDGDTVAKRASLTSARGDFHEQSSGPVPSAVPPVAPGRLAPDAEAPASETLPTDAAAAVAPNVPESAAPTAAQVDATDGDTFMHTVRTGDSVNDLAYANGLRPDTIVRANGLTNPNRILPGQRLVIPSDDSYAPPAQPSPTARSSGNRELDFIAMIASGAQESQRVTGVPASVTIGQAILETYWGTSFLAREANNYFGIKAHARPGPAGVVWIDAWEVENGNNVTRQEPFRKYNTVAESLVEHGRFFIENRRYAHALQAANDPKEFARRINEAGYATDPAYAAKLIAYMDRYNLYQYDLN